jgi:hypothetical protein
MNFHRKDTECAKGLKKIPGFAEKLDGVIFVACGAYFSRRFSKEPTTCP